MLGRDRPGRSRDMAASRLHSAWKVAALLSATCLTLLLLAELCIKLTFFGWYDSPGALLMPSEDPILIYELRPGTRIRSTYLNPDQTDWKYSVNINEHGFRGG